MEIKIAGLVDDSIVDGPGVRYSVFVQGCPHHCEGCHNPQTWDFEGGTIMTTEEIFKKIIADDMLDGVTFTGGEPFCQCRPLAELADMLRAHKPEINIMSYTGFEYEYLVEHANEENGFMELLKRLDSLVDGPFVLEKRSLELNFRGSSNQRFLDVPASLREGRAVTVRDDWNNVDIKLI
ncbi:anaerobic ribonucleoside-triphosphate reductase activating protein [Ruminococcus sp. YE71]|uniref:anaerobic ribonucleoside-triphosphate reductase activating protein n=1 Tax=unclassified Ruminococcus TaxID=2608920 RepID=UPI00088011EC|nr:MULTISPECIES: anaerobic ribonucleoside-triphosphate reductase activating protein [unclassified Ruminococcus]SDA24245.1 anaerobic ribonucleoside-triphosphate reductase activating protein [Ruminococcus sp. YE78]SFW41685.1 anaerobic ribonucleoside-triphosphate reductase activating protein [Ruminococcus sp. YE71]